MMPHVQNSFRLAIAALLLWGVAGCGPSAAPMGEPGAVKKSSRDQPGGPSLTQNQTATALQELTLEVTGMS